MALQPFSVRVGAALPCVKAMAAFADVKEALLRFLSGVEGETPEGRKAKLENLCLRHHATEPLHVFARVTHGVIHGERLPPVSCFDDISMNPVPEACPSRRR